MKSKTSSARFVENTRVALIAIGFLSLIFLLTYITWSK
jgi:hypothetical protein